MAQFRTDINELDEKISTRYEVVMIADSYGNVSQGTGGSAVDAFGRLRTSSPYTLFDSSHRYADNGRWATSTSNGGNTSYLPNESTIAMNVTSTAGSKVYRETYRVFSYQPGKSLFTLNSFVFAAQVEGLRQRVGLFGESNGIFLENDGTGNHLVLRTNVSGTPSDANKVAQANWNVDPFDGTGPSGVTLDTSKANLLWMDVEWLGVGDVRCGFVVDGKIHVAHQFHNTNRNTGVYMTTATLPLRYEIENISASGSHTLKQICSTAMSEGGYERRATRDIVIRSTNIAASTTAYTPIISYRLNGNQDAVIVPDTYQVFTDGSSNFELVMLKNPTTLTNATTLTWVTKGNIEYCIDATALTGGTIWEHQYLSATNQAGGAFVQDQQYNWDLQLGRNSFTDTSDVYVLAAKSLESNTQNIKGTITYWDLS